MIRSVNLSHVSCTMLPWLQTWLQAYADVLPRPPQAPPNEAAPLYLQYAALEEEHGLARAAMEVCITAIITCG